MGQCCTRLVLIYTISNSKISWVSPHHRDGAHKRMSLRRAGRRGLLSYVHPPCLSAAHLGPERNFLHKIIILSQANIWVSVSKERRGPAHSDPKAPIAARNGLFIGAVSARRGITLAFLPHWTDASRGIRNESIAQRTELERTECVSGGSA